MFPDRPRSSSPGSSGGLFLKLVSGQPPIRGLLVGTPKLFKTHYRGDRGLPSLDCLALPECPECAKGNRPGDRFKINFIIRENGTYVSKILEGSWKLYDNLAAIHKSGYDLSKNLIELSKAGKETIALPLPVGGQVSEQQLAQIKSVPLKSLERTKSEAFVADIPTMGAFERNEDVPF